MGTYVERLWQPEDTGGLSRKDRAAGRYLAYVPDELSLRLPQLGERAQSAAEDALAVLARADERVGSRGGYLSHLLIRSESISSSWIEGNRVTPKKLAIAESLKQGTQAALDVVPSLCRRQRVMCHASLTTWHSSSPPQRGIRLCGQPLLTLSLKPFTLSSMATVEQVERSFTPCSEELMR